MVHSGEQAGYRFQHRRDHGDFPQNARHDSDGETGTPASGAIVRLIPRQMQGAALIIPSTTADRDGTFEVKGMTNGLTPCSSTSVPLETLT